MSDPSDNTVCDHCGDPLRYEDSYSIGDSEVCSECYDDTTCDCAVCGERFHKRDSGLVVMLLQAVGDVASGIYLVRRWPFFVQPMIGSGSIWNDALHRIADLPERIRAEDDCPGQWICLACAKPYEKQRPPELVTELASPLREDLRLLRYRTLFGTVHTYMGQRCMVGEPLVGKIDDGETT